MDKSLLRRRQLFVYFGLGVGGAVGIASPIIKQAFISSLQENRSGNPIESSNHPTVAAAESSQEHSLPEFQGISRWLNSPPLAIAELKGSVVLVQFWTFACINCQRTLPYIVKWHQQYANQGLKVIGVHTPEFAFEREVNNIEAALRQHQITYAVPMDNDYQTWNAYSNRYWPHLFLADRQGVIRYDHIGEGAYDQTEQTIRQLLEG